MKQDKAKKTAPANSKGNDELYRKTSVSLILGAYHSMVNGVGSLPDDILRKHRVKDLFENLSERLYAEHAVSLWSVKDEESIKLMQQATGRHGKEESWRFTLERVLLPEASSGNKDAAELLTLFAVYLDERNAKKLAAELLVKAGKSTAGRGPILEQLNDAVYFNKLKDGGAELIHALFQIDKERAREVAQSKLMIGNAEEKAECVELLATQDMGPYCYREALKYLKFWGSKLDQEDSLRQFYYAIVRKAFMGKTIDTASALDYLKPGYQKELYDRGLEGLEALVRQIAPAEASHFIGECLIAAASKREFSGDETFMSYANGLKGEAKLAFIEKALTKITDSEALWGLGKLAIGKLEIDRLCRCLAKALDSRPRIDALLQLILQVITKEHGFEDLRKSKTAIDLEKLHQAALACLDRVEDDSLALNAIKQFAFYGKVKDMPATISKIEKLLDHIEGEQLEEAVMLALVIVCRFKEFGPQVNELLGKRLAKEGENAVRDALLKIITKEVSYGIEHIYDPAISCLAANRDQECIGRLGNHLNSSSCNHAGHLLADFLAIHAATGNEQAISLLEKNHVDLVRWETVNKALIRAHKQGSKETKKRITEAITKRFRQSLLDKDNRSSYFDGFEAAKAIKGESAVRKGFIAAFAAFPGDTTPTAGIARLIEQAGDLLTPKELVQFRQTLKGVANRLTDRLKKMKEERHYLLKDYERAYSHLIVAIGKQLA